MNAHIKDDGVTITSDAIGDADGYGKTEATVDTATNKGIANITVDFGADMDGARIEFPKSIGATTRLGVVWDAETGTWSLTPESARLVHPNNPDQQTAENKPNEDGVDSVITIMKDGEAMPETTITLKDTEIDTTNLESNDFIKF